MNPLESWEEFLKNLRQNIRRNLQSQVDSNFTLRTYDDKNKYLRVPEMGPGGELLVKRKFELSKLFWEQVLEETRSFREEYPDHHINVGLPLANLGISLISQGKVFDGVILIFNAFDDDKNTLKLFELGDIDPISEFVQSLLFQQFENTIAIRMGKTRKGISVKKLIDYCHTLKPEKRIQIFYILSELDDALRKSYLAFKTPEIIIPKLISAWLQLSMFLDSGLKDKQNKKGEDFYNLLEAELKRLKTLNGMEKSFLNGKDKPKTSRDLNEAIILIGNQASRTLLEKKCLTIWLIRNYYSHNATDISFNLFIRNYIKYAYWLIDLILKLQ